MAGDEEQASEQSPLLSTKRRASFHSIVSSHVSQDEQLLADTSVGERLPYNDYTTIDWLHDLVRFQERSLPSILMSSGQKLSSSPRGPWKIGLTEQPDFSVRWSSRMDYCRAQRHWDCYSGCSRRLSNANRQRLENRVLSQEPHSGQRVLLYKQNTLPDVGRDWRDLCRMALLDRKLLGSIHSLHCLGSPVWRK